MEQSEFRVLKKHCFLMGKNTVQAKQWLDESYPDSAPSEQMVKKWFADFKLGRTNPMMLNALVPQILQLFQKTSSESRIWFWPIVN